MKGYLSYRDKGLSLIKRGVQCWERTKEHPQRSTITIKKKNRFVKGGTLAFKWVLGFWRHPAFSTFDLAPSPGTVRKVSTGP